MAEEERDYPPRAMTESEALEDAHRGKAAFEVAYPEEGKRKTFMPYVSRWRGPIPDYYDVPPFAAYNARRDQGIARCTAQINHEALNGSAKPDWEEALRDPLLEMLENHTVSLGGGKGRSEAVDLGKSNPPVPIRGRWSFRRRGEP